MIEGPRNGGDGHMILINDGTEKEFMKVKAVDKENDRIYIQSAEHIDYFMEIPWEDMSISTAMWFRTDHGRGGLRRHFSFFISKEGFISPY